jgi:hypothetical protein
MRQLLEPDDVAYLVTKLDADEDGGYDYRTFVKVAYGQQKAAKDYYAKQLGGLTPRARTTSSVPAASPAPAPAPAPTPTKRPSRTKSEPRASTPPRIVEPVEETPVVPPIICQSRPSFS